MKVPHSNEALKELVNPFLYNEFEELTKVGQSLDRSATIGVLLSDSSLWELVTNSITEIRDEKLARDKYLTDVLFTDDNGINKGESYLKAGGYGTFVINILLWLVILGAIGTSILNKDLLKL